MAEKLMKYYQFMGDKRGLAGKMSLAQETKIPSAKAAFEPDSPDNLTLFKKAIEKITGESAPVF